EGKNSYEKRVTVYRPIPRITVTASGQSPESHLRQAIFFFSDGFVIRGEGPEPNNPWRVSSDGPSRPDDRCYPTKRSALQPPWGAGLGMAAAGLRDARKRVRLAASRPSSGMAGAANRPTLSGGIGFASGADFANFAKPLVR